MAGVRTEGTGLPRPGTAPPRTSPPVVPPPQEVNRRHPTTPCPRGAARTPRRPSTTLQRTTSRPPTLDPEPPQLTTPLKAAQPAWTPVNSRPARGAGSPCPRAKQYDRPAAAQAWPGGRLPEAKPAAARCTSTPDTVPRPRPGARLRRGVRGVRRGRDPVGVLRRPRPASQARQRAEAIEGERDIGHRPAQTVRAASWSRSRRGGPRPAHLARRGRPYRGRLYPGQGEGGTFTWTAPIRAQPRPTHGAGGAQPAPAAWSLPRISSAANVTARKLVGDPLEADASLRARNTAERLLTPMRSPRRPRRETGGSRRMRGTGGRPQAPTEP